MAHWHGLHMSVEQEKFEHDTVNVGEKHVESKYTWFLMENSWQEQSQLEKA